MAASILLLAGLILLILLISFIAVSHLNSAIAGAPTVPSNPHVIQAALKLANAKPGEKLLDLGCGYGRVLHSAQKLGLNAQGADISLACFLWNKIRGRKVRLENALTTNLKGFDIIYIYLLPKLVNQLAPRLKKLKKGTRLIFVSFQPDGWEPAKTVKVGQFKIYLYQRI